MADFFTEEMARNYDERNSRLAPISEAMQFLIRLTLADLPKRSRILSIGAGTGTEILSLAKEFPEWKFVALEPSLAMLNICRKKLQDEGLGDRCEFVHGYIQDLPDGADYDGALSILVAHFIKREERPAFFQEVQRRLKTGGRFVNTEISFALDSLEFPLMLKNWEKVQEKMGATPESIASLPRQLREMLSVLSPVETEELLRKAGFDTPVRFFQAFMICGWHGTKN